MHFAYAFSAASYYDCFFVVYIKIDNQLRTPDMN
jgi:hypothetical protein